MKKNYIIYFLVLVNHHQLNFAIYEWKRMVAMNHKTKQCNCLEGNDELFFDDLTKAHLYEIWFGKFVHHHL
jgi:hypothetical protein